MFTCWQGSRQNCRIWRTMTLQLEAPLRKMEMKTLSLTAQEIIKDVVTINSFVLRVRVVDKVKRLVIILQLIARLPVEKAE